jgi:hypothetical protein
MHIHAYSWLGEKAAFDEDWLRRLPDPPRPPVSPEERERFRAAVEEFRRSELPPVRTGQWLLKHPGLVRGTFREPGPAAAWLSARLAEVAPHFHSPADAAPERLAHLVASARETLRLGDDVSTGFYVGRAQFLSLALIPCSPNRTEPALPCPLAQARSPGGG